MKLHLIGHDEKYAVEQSLLTLFPAERPVYGEVDREADAVWAVITLAEDAEAVTVTTELCVDGKSETHSYSHPLRGTDYEREGQRRHTIGLSFFGAAKKLLGIAPAWGSLTGVRPTKVAIAAMAEHGRERAERVLQDTYFVTPARARLAIECAEAGLRAEAALEPRDISLYVGIPFCPTRCAYCSFVSQSVEKSLALIEPYLDALCREIEDAAAMVRRLGLRVKSFYMGGGTPTTLSAPQMDRLLTALETHFDLSACAERTIEAGRPDTITLDKLRVLKDHATTRGSINPQSMSDEVLRAIGRHHTAADIENAMRMVDEVGFASVNMDLIAGLPQDTVERFRDTLTRVLDFGTDNITIHTLSLKKGSRITLEQSRIPSPEEVGEMLDFAAPLLRAQDFAPYYLYRQKYMSGSFENVGWAKPGGECLYNIYIMEELHTILSLGAGGSTKLVDRKGEYIERVFNHNYPQEYIERPEKLGSNREAFAAFYTDRMKGENGK